MDPTRGLDGTVAGYAVVRRIGSDARAEVLLGRGPRPAGPGGDAASLVALKVFRPGGDPALIIREVSALLAAPTALPTLRDVATGPDGRLCLVLDHLAGLGLDRLLAARGRLAAGEIVTIAAPVTAAVQALHEAGLSQPTVRPDGVRFDERGRPVLLGLGTLTDLPAGGAGVPVRREAAAGLTQFLRTLLDHLDPDDPASPGTPALLSEFEDTIVARPFPASLVGLEAALFNWAPARRVTAAVPGDGPVAESGGESARGPAPVPARTTHAPAITGVPPDRRWLQGLRRWRSAAGQVGPTMFRRLPRRPILVGVGVAVAVLLAGLGTLPGVGADPGAGGAGERGTTGAGEGTDAPERGAEGGAGADDADSAVVEGDDPAAAVLALLDRRARCLATASVLCLEGVDQPGSVAMAADAYLIHRLEAGPGTGTDTVAVDPPTAELRERSGNAALVVVTGGVNAQPASALVIKGEAGWRLRELFDY